MYRTNLFTWMASLQTGNYVTGKSDVALRSVGQSVGVFPFRWFYYLGDFACLLLCRRLLSDSVTRVSFGRYSVIDWLIDWLVGWSVNGIVCTATATVMYRTVHNVVCPCPSVCTTVLNWLIQLLAVYCVVHKTLCRWQHLVSLSSLSSSSSNKLS